MTDLTRRALNAGAAATALALAMPSLASAQIPAKPNILFIVVDDLNDWASPWGGYPLVTDARTPNIAWLAARGCRFDRAYTTTPYCATSRTSFLYGLYPTTTGVYTKGEDWPKGSQIQSGQKSLPWLLRDAGYYTAGIGKIFHTGWRNDDGDGKRAASQYPGAWDFFENCGRGACVAPKEPGEGAFGPGEGYGPAKTAKELRPDTIRVNYAIANVINEPHGGKPWALFMGLQKPHLNWYPPAEFLAQFPIEDIVYPLGVMSEDARCGVTYETSKDLRDEPKAGWKMSQQFKDSLGSKGKPGFMNDPACKAWKEAIQHYCAEIAYADYNIGLLRQALEASGQLDDTIIVMLSDHGWQLGEKLAWRKFTLWERATRLPLVIAGPGVTAGVCRTPVSVVDLVPTLMDLATGSVPARAKIGRFALDGVSRKDWLASPETPRQNAVWSCWGLGLDEGGPLTGRDFLNFSVRSNTARGIYYADGSSALYRKGGPDDDEFEFHNLVPRGGKAALAELAALRASARIPASARWAPRAGGGSDDED
ncbi:sulfatase-like hydrolase/transferase [Chenggangzhangella methanolivorans]|uniref:Sulfatase-like hydrolase/transferase n=1 Tax=Chenggangzhangella methanolivorans TaxID=1437009 RepID=A0A9E6UM89_9HYPH|nr:sulfatase-like hydrolase/transferase [Chenggangzhangella methanolivorans]QZN99805.1 sulfatase-like hydrolase/transferase [Chenggangzhangella methanolivorans]